MAERHPDLRHSKARGAFFTPPAIADFLADWAIGDNASATVLDPTCGESVFLLAAARRLKELGVPARAMCDQVFGVDLHKESLDESRKRLQSQGLDAHLVRTNIFDVETPGQLGCSLPQMDVIIGNPPFVRYQDHVGEARRKSVAAAFSQGVRLNGLASSWAAVLVHACSFLKPDGRLAVVLPAELLTVNYAEPVRRWLRRKFGSVHLVMFERLQFDGVIEKVVLVVAQGSGGCDSFSLLYLNDADDLQTLHPFDAISATPADEGKWTDLLLPVSQRQLFKRVTDEHFTPLRTYGSPELGTVTGANSFFTFSEAAREKWQLDNSHVCAVSPPGTRHLKGLSFTKGDWNRLRDAGEAVWLLHPKADDKSAALKAYVKHGKRLGVDEAYKCQVRTPWWRPPRVPTPDLFFTYMSHRYPRLIANTAGVSFVNSMHGVRFRPSAAKVAKAALPLLMLNSATMLGAEIHGRSYGGGVLKMEPREAGLLPVPDATALTRAWEVLKTEKASHDRQLRNGMWVEVAKRVDEVLLHGSMGIETKDVVELHEAARSLRERRIGSPRTA